MIAKVIVDISTSQTDKIFDYLIPSDMSLSKGERVLVPFGNRRLEGFCIELATQSQCNTLKEIIAKLDDFVGITPEMLELMQYMKSRFYIRYVDSLRLFIPPTLRGGKSKTLTNLYIRLADGITAEEMLTALPTKAVAQRLLVERLAESGELLKELSKDFSASCINALVKLGYVVKEDKVIIRSPFKNITAQKPKNYVLTSNQEVALKEIFEAQQETILLHGVTGSGKTVIYMEAIQRVLDEGKTAIMLVPEISLTPQTLKNFRGYFGNNVAMIHSGLSDGERHDEWKRLHSGEARIVVGARSAIFAPLTNVGLIVMDEEHDSSYISESNPRFMTVEVARFRAKYNNAKVILGSATPSIESYLLAKKGEYKLIEINQRIAVGGMPTINIVDMANEIYAGNNSIFSGVFANKLKQTIENGEQAMIFLNRRGHSSFVMCKKCGYTAKCEHCDVTLTYHSVNNRLKCHYCGEGYHMLTHCPTCGSDKIKYGKIGTQQVVDEIKKLMPNVAVLRMDNETTTTKDAYLQILGDFANAEAQVLVGTQMIAKGHDFPEVTLVGIMDADMSLYHADYRSNERTFQIVTQVAGRAGRSEKSGEIYLQTYSPRHFVYKMAKAYDYKAFFAKENNTREVTSFPPYSTIVRVLMSAENEEDIIECAKNIYKQTKVLQSQFEKEFYYLQAMRSPIKKINGKHRFQILIRIKRPQESQIIGQLYEIIDNNKYKNVTVFAEINPQNLN